MPFPYTQSQVQNFCANLNCCAGTKGYEFLQKEIKGKDCECELTALKYLLRANKIICSYLPAGVINEGIKASIVMSFDDFSGLDAVTITTPDFSHQLSGSFTTAQALAAVVVWVNANTTYTSVSTNDGINQLQLVAPTGENNDKIVTIDFLVAPGTHYIYRGALQGGEYTRTEEDNCLTDDEATQLFENGCGTCACGCTDFLTDAQP